MTRDGARASIALLLLLTGTYSQHQRYRHTSSKYGFVDNFVADCTGITICAAYLPSLHATA